jgi:LPS-assembly lipoprotein
MFQTKFSTSSLLKSAILLSFVSVVASCGFTPLYKKTNGDKSNSCTNFTVEKIKSFSISGQKMQYNLQDRLNQACINQNKEYKIQVDVVKTKGAGSIQKDREVTRYTLNLVGSYKVFEGDSEKAKFDGKSVMVGSFDAVTSDYGTYALEDDTQEKLLEEMANDISLKISSQLLSKRK